jgi:hypothetical protein
MTERWMASNSVISSSITNVDTPIRRVIRATETIPPPPFTEMYSCHVDVHDKTGPQKKPSPASGRTVRKTVPTKSVFAPGQISPNPTLFDRKGYLIE